MRLVALIACVVSFALVAAGCGGDDESASSADAWADEFCSTVQGWADELERIREDLGDVSSLTSDSIEQASEDADAVTEDFLEELRDLGGPDTPSGDAVEQEVEELSDIVDAEREDIRQAVEDASGLAEIAEAVGEVGTSVAAMTSAVQQTLEAIDEADVEGEVRAAVDESEACDALRAENE
jgi:hypothetical protein